MRDKFDVIGLSIGVVGVLIFCLILGSCTLKINEQDNKIVSECIAAGGNYEHRTGDCLMVRD